MGRAGTVVDGSGEAPGEEEAGGGERGALSKRPVRAWRPHGPRGSALDAGIGRSPHGRPSGALRQETRRQGEKPRGLAGPSRERPRGGPGSRSPRGSIRLWVEAPTGHDVLRYAAAAGTVLTHPSGAVVRRFTGVGTPHFPGSRRGMDHRGGRRTFPSHVRRGVDEQPFHGGDHRAAGGLRSETLPGR